MTMNQASEPSQTPGPGTTDPGTSASGPASPQTPAIPAQRDPVIRTIAISDIVDALALGLRDVQRAPRQSLLFGAFYAAGGITLVLILAVFKMTYLAYPLAAGFAIIGPFVALGLYQVSRDLESGTQPSLRRSWEAARDRREIRWMAFVVGFFFVIWMYQVRLLLALFLGHTGAFASLEEFLHIVLTTNNGLLFLMIGNIVGAILSLAIFSITVVSFPLLLERDVDFVTAMITSVRAVATNPMPMIGWAAIVVALLVISTVPMFLGLVVTLPLLGHTTWHLYRRLVAPSGDGTSTAP